MSQKDRVKSAFDITRKAEGMNTEDKAKIEAMVFVMADKFLSRVEMEEIKEEIRMTKLGQMLVERRRKRRRSAAVQPTDYFSYR